MHVHDTYFIVAHFHYIMVGGTIMGYLGGLHYWWPKITGRIYPEWWARVAALIVFVGFNLTFFPQFVLGYLGMPRRYHVYPEEFQVLNVMSSAGASILGVGYLLPDDLPRLVDALRAARPPANPWGAKGLEWETPSPPPTENFARAARGDAKRPTTYAPRRRWPRLSEPADAHAHAHHPALRAPLRRACASRRTRPRLGMWVFLAQEIMFFGGLFLAYASTAALYPARFAEASHHLDWKLGAINTAVLIGSSLTMALAVHAAALGHRKADRGLAAAHHRAGLGVPRRQGGRVRATSSSTTWCPGPRLPASTGTASARDAAADLLLALLRHDRPARAAHDHRHPDPRLHGLAGAGRAASGPRTTRRWRSPGLYWHFVDIVWIFLFPLLYLIHG